MNETCMTCELRDAAFKTRLTSGAGGHQTRILCVGCARKETTYDVRELVRLFVPIFRPLWDVLVILRDVAPDRIGRIIIPALSFDSRGKLRTEQASYGTVLAIGPGRLHRIKVGERRFTGGRDPIPQEIVVGGRVLFNDKHEIGTTQWRDLSLVHEFDVMLVEEKQDAAAE
jgi:hypothetical protein